MTIIINADHIGQRVDNFLLGQFKLVPKSRIYKAIRKGEVRVNKKRVKPEERLKEGDEVTVKCIEIDTQGRVNLSRKVLLEGGEDSGTLTQRSSKPFKPTSSHKFKN